MRWARAMHHGLRNQVEQGLSVIESSRLSFTRGIMGRIVRDLVSLPRERVAEQFQVAEDEVSSLIRFMSSVNFAAALDVPVWEVSRRLHHLTDEDPLKVPGGCCVCASRREYTAWVRTPVDSFEHPPSDLERSRYPSSNVVPVTRPIAPAAL